MNSIRFARLALCSALVAGSVVACGDDEFVGPDGQPVRSGTVVVRLNSASSAAFDVAPGAAADVALSFDAVARVRLDSVQKVELFVVRIDGKKEDADSTAAADSSTSDAERNRGGWTAVAEPKAKIDLAALRGDSGSTLGKAALPVGTYRSFRLIIDPAQSSVTLKDGTVLTSTSNPGVKFPSADRSGIKVQVRRPVAVGGDSTTKLDLDFDVSDSFQMRGPNMKNGLIFKPVIKLR